VDNWDGLRGQRAYVELRKLIRRDSLYSQTSWFKLEKKMEGLQRWVQQDPTTESPHLEEVIVVKEYSDLGQAEESFLGQKSCYGLHGKKCGFT
jgi:hypothetical protein